MNAERLIKHFDRIAEAPGAVPRLRRFVLELAVTGRLEPQMPTDESAADLVRRMNKGKGGGRQPPSSAAGPRLPPSWVWATIDDVRDVDPRAITDGPFGANLKTAHYVPSPGYRVIRLQNVGAGIFRDEQKSFVSREHFARLEKHHVYAGDLVVAGLVDPLVRCCQVPDGIGPALVKADCYRFKVHPAFFARFALYYLNSPVVQRFAIAHHHGMTLVRIGLGNFRKLPIPVPPYSEQQRIVAKVDELMAVLDRLKVAQAERGKKRSESQSSAFHRAVRSQAGAGVPSAALASSSLGSIVASEEVDCVRLLIRDLAVRGRLVSRTTDDDRVETSLMAQGAPETSRRDADVIERAAAGLGMIPTHWVLASLEQLASDITDCPHSTPKWTNTGELCIRTNQLRPGSIDLSEPKFVSKQTYDQRVARLLPTVDDILYSREGGILGVAARVPPGVRLCLGQRMMLIRAGRLLDSAYLELVLNSPFITDLAKDLTTGGAAPRVNMSSIRAYPIPVPPVGEQRRIVAKVDELMTLCDRLEAQLAFSERESVRFLEAVLREVLADDDATRSGPSSSTGSGGVASQESP